MAHKSISKKKKIYRDEYRYVVLRLWDKNLDPDKITKTLDLKPSDSWRRGIVIGKCGKTYRIPYGQWNLKSCVRRNAPIANHIRDILNRIAPKKKQFKRILKKVKADLNIAVEPHKELAVAGYTLPADIISEITSLGIDIHFSFHIPQAWDELFEET